VFSGRGRRGWTREVVCLIAKSTEEASPQYEKIEDGGTATTTTTASDTATYQIGYNHNDAATTPYYQLADANHGGVQPDIEMSQLPEREKPFNPSLIPTTLTKVKSPKVKTPKKQNQPTAGGGGGGGIQSILITDKSKIQLVSTIKPLNPFVR